MREQAKNIAQLMRQLSNENRLLILCALLEQPLTVGEIAKKVNDITLPALSQHLNKLKNGGLIQSEKQGQHITYRIKDERLRDLMELLKEKYCKETL